MTNEEVLTKAIEKALENGWNMFGFAGKLLHWNVNEAEYPYQSWLFGRMDHRYVYQLQVSLNDILFNHDFAKAFWGEEEVEVVIDDFLLSKEPQPFMGGTIEYPYYESAGISYKCKAYLYHLQKLVLEEEPLGYLERFVCEEAS